MSELNLFCFITNLAITVLVGALLPILPALTRKAFLFGVKIPEEMQSHPQAKALKRRYAIACVFGMAAVLALDIIQFALWPDLTLLAVCYIPLLTIPVQAIAFIPNWKRAVKLKEENGWSVSQAAFAETRSSHSRGNLSSVPWGYYVISLLMIVISVMIILARYPQLPDPVPTHFDFNMNPDAWTAKSLGTVLIMPVINFFTALLMAGTAVTIVKTKLQISPENPALSFAQHRAYRRYMGHGMGVLTLGIVAGMTLIGLMTVMPAMNMSFTAMMLIMLLPCAPLIVIPFRIGQGGCRLNPEITEADALAAGYRPPETAEAAIGRGDDKFWALGMFYHNPDDPAILVEDRFGSNIGLNYARAGVKIGVAILVFTVIGAYVWMTPLLFSL